MRRKIFTTASLLSLLLFVATVVLWVGSYLSPWQVQFSGSRGPNGGIVDARELGLYLDSADGVLFIRYRYDYDFPTPYWKIATLFFALAAYPWVPWEKLRLPDRHVAVNCCQSCSYDLTGNTSGVCPECGTSVAGDAGT